MFSIKTKGNFSNIESFLKRSQKQDLTDILTKYAEKGLQELKIATPKDTGNTANCWNYNIVKNKNGVSIEWTNSNNNDGMPIVILLQYGHATKSGTFVQGIDFINPAIRPVFDNIAEDIGKEVFK